MFDAGPTVATWVYEVQLVAGEEGEREAEKKREAGRVEKAVDGEAKKVD